MIKEIRVFTFLEGQRTHKSSQSVKEFNRVYHEAEGLPKLLGYRLSLAGGEILMFDAGLSLDKWYKYDMSSHQKMKFVCEMLR